MRILWSTGASLASALLLAQSTAVTFSAVIDGMAVPIDSVWVRNATAGGDTMLYTPDTVLTLGIITGSGEVISSGAEAGLGMGPAVPNPFDGATRFNVNVKDEGELLLTTYDAVGKMLASGRHYVGKGTHSFSHSGGPQGVLFVEARWGGQRAVQRLLNTNGGSEVGIRHLGWYDMQHTARRKDGWFTWQLGDSLFYIAYATGPYGYIFSASIGETPMGPSIPVFDLLPGVVCAQEPVVVDIDGNVYPVVQIGNQCWMAGDLRTGRYRNGAAISNVPNNNDGIEMWSTLTTGAYSADATLQSRVYNWYAVVNATICPEGWHVPSTGDWAQLVDHLGSNVGGKLKAMSTRWTEPNIGATNESGFSGLPRGFRDYNGYFQRVGDQGHWWSSTPDGDNSASYSTIVYYNDTLIQNTILKRTGCCIRCLRD